ncbi:hypothetical protein LCGC14_1981260 [marine sediment metagenome]|uniref:Ribbon-helix-helix protein CopG domain-containing protein n=1 Tax=marine sediment metagenome TaxID=412755 RepID=A0A0F9HM50_9ZZZZ
MTKTQYDKIYVIFKALNKEVYDWVLSKSQDGDLSRSAFILQCLKKIKKAEENEDGEKTNTS